MQIDFIVLINPNPNAKKKLPNNFGQVHKKKPPYIQSFYPPRFRGVLDFPQLYVRGGIEIVDFLRGGLLVKGGYAT